MLLNFLKDIQKHQKNQKFLRKVKKARKALLKEMSFNRDVGFRYLSSSPPQKDGPDIVRRRKKKSNGGSAHKLYRSQSEMTLNELDHKKLRFVNDNLSDADTSFHSHSSVPECNKTLNDNDNNNNHRQSSSKNSSFNDIDDSDEHHEHHKRLKNKKKNKKYKRAIVAPGFSHVAPLLTTSISCDANNNSSDQSPPIIDDVPNNWMPLFLPSYKSRLTRFQRIFEEIPPNEKLVDDFVCALRRDILLQGRLYISVNYISFHSNILGYETILTVKFSDITKISKASTMKVFQNAIEIHTASGEKHILTSFMSRERAFALMMKLWQNSGNVDELSGQQQPKITWPEICKYIRNSYITESLPLDLSELDELDLQDILKGKTITKKLQHKKDKIRLLEFERSHRRSDSVTSFTSAFEDLPDDESSTSGVVNKQETIPSANSINNDLLQNTQLDVNNNSIFSIDQTNILKKIIPASLSKWLDGCFNEKNIIRVCVLISIVLLLVQLLLFCWVSMFETKINDYERFLVDALASRRLQLQQHSILPDSV